MFRSPSVVIVAFLKQVNNPCARIRRFFCDTSYMCESFAVEISTFEMDTSSLWEKEVVNGGPDLGGKFEE